MANALHRHLGAEGILLHTLITYGSPEGCHWGWGTHTWQLWFMEMIRTVWHLFRDINQGCFPDRLLFSPNFVAHKKSPLRQICAACVSGRTQQQHRQQKYCIIWLQKSLRSDLSCFWLWTLHFAVHYKACFEDFFTCRPVLAMAMSGAWVLWSAAGYLSHTDPVLLPQQRADYFLASFFFNKKGNNKYSFEKLHAWRNILLACVSKPLYQKALFF